MDTMQYITIAGVDKPVSRLVQGTAVLTTKEQDSAFALLDGVFELGCNTFDTAHVYSNGESERVLGHWIQSRGIRDDVVILGKGAHPYSGRNRVTSQDIRDDIQESLERLQVDMIDIYLLHRDDPSVSVGSIVGVLNECRRAGVIGIFGGSNWSFERVQLANHYAKQHNLEPFAVSSPQFSLPIMVKPSWDGCISIGGSQGANARAWYAQNQIPLFVWSSLAGGFMTGRFQRDNLGQFDDYLDTVTIHAFCYEENFQRLDRATTMAKEKGLSLPQLGIAYNMSQPLNIFALVGCKSPAEFKDNLQAINTTLTPAEIHYLESGKETST